MAAPSGCAAGQTKYTAIRLGYAQNGRTVTFVHDESWCWDQVSTSCPTNYQIGYAREFRYDGARARYLNRELSPAGLLMNPPQFNSLSDTWTDYDGDSTYGDFEVTPGYPPTVTNKRSYQPGLAQVDPWVSSGGTATDYVMSDHLGTTRGLIAPNNVPTDAAVYTAFGERISGTNHRFGYVGSFGYQSHAEFPFLHVGTRYYDPESGRFLQRDPIGIRGGLNLYEYVRSRVTIAVDPKGLELPYDGYPYNQPLPDPPVQSPADIQEEKEGQDHYRIVVQVAAGIGAIVIGGPVGIGLGCGIVIWQGIEQW